MKILAKILAIVTIFCIVASCQGEPNVPANPDSSETTDDPDKPVTPEDPPGGFVIKATLSPFTKASFIEDGRDHHFVGNWSIGDEVFGFTSDGTPVSFTVKSMDAATFTATLEQTTEVEITEGTTVHAIFCPGKTVSDLSGQTLALDFTRQAPDVVPVLYLATATASEDALSFALESVVSVIGISAPVFPKPTTADKLLTITASGHEIVSSGVVSVSDGALVFQGNAPDRFITKIVNAGPVVSGDSFTIEDPVYIVVPTSPVSCISAIDNRNNFFVYSLEDATDETGYYRISETTFTAVSLPVSSGLTVGNLVWAKANLGGSGLTDMGDIYRWSDIGKIYTERTGTTSVAFDEAHSGGFNSYEGECYLSGGVYTKYNRTDNKTVLDPVDDIVCLTYPGSGWHMPTKEDFDALFAGPNLVTYNSGNGNNVGTTVALGEKSVFFRGTTQVCAPSSKDKTTIGKRGRFWTSTIEPENYSESGGNPDYIQFNGADGRSAEAPVVSTAYRHSGYSIRPVRTVE